MFKKKYIIIAMIFFYKNNYVNCIGGFDVGNLGIAQNNIKNNGGTGPNKIKIIKPKNNDDSVKLLFKLLEKNRYRFDKKGNFDPGGCKNLYEFLNNTDAKKWDNFGKFINFGTTGDKNEDKIIQKDNLNFLIEHPGVVSLLESNLDDLLNIKNDVKNLSSDITTKPIAEAYNAILSSKELVDLLKNMDKKSLMKINDLLKLYATVDVRDRTCVEGKLVSSYESFIYYTCGRKFFTMFKNNQKDIVEIAKTQILPIFKEYTNSLKQLLIEFNKNKRNEESIKNLKEEFKRHTDIIKERIKKDTDAYGAGKVKEGFQRKVGAYKQCSSKPKEIVT